MLTVFILGKVERYMYRQPASMKINILLIMIITVTGHLCVYPCLSACNWLHLSVRTPSNSFSSFYFLLYLYTPIRQHYPHQLVSDIRE